MEIADRLKDREDKERLGREKRLRQHKNYILHTRRVSEREAAEMRFINRREREAAEPDGTKRWKFWRVEVWADHETLYQAWFRDTDYGGRDKALAAAKRWRDRVVSALSRVGWVPPVGMRAHLMKKRKGVV